MSNVPKLRFSEFSGEWEEKKLGDIGKVTMCKRIMKDQTLPLGDIPFYKIGTFGKEADAYIPQELYENFKEKYPFPKKGDILISASGTIGRTVIYDGIPAYFQDSNIVWIDNNDNLVKNSFLLYCYTNTKWNTEDTTIARLYNENLRNVKITIPSLKEQEKIASFLTSVDIRIVQLTKKESLLQEYKKGVMNKIFNQEIRFKDDDGSEFPEWEDKKLGKLSDVRDGTHDSPKYYDEGYPLITSKNLLQNGTIDFNNVSLILKEDYININKRSKVNINDILFGMIGTIGNPVIVNKEGFAIKNVALIKEQELLLNRFLIHYLKSFLIEKQFYEQNTGGTQKFIALGVIRDLQIKLPCLEEQTKIANFLSSIDKKIELTTKELNSTKEFKKALLQQMFV